MLHIGALDVSNLMCIPAAYRDPRMQDVFTRVAAACRKHEKAMGVGGARGDLALQRDLVALGVRYLTTGLTLAF
jgi:2-keto-3-deoxy-L-rhamnonate aldolase RhmA